MLIFIDESGDTGYKIEKGSSKYLVLAMLVINDEYTAEKISIAITKFKIINKLHPNLELKFNKLSKKLKLEFLKYIVKFEFKIYAVVVKKANYSLGNNSEDYISILRLLLSKIQCLRKEVKVRIDGFGNVKTRRAIIKDLKMYMSENQYRNLASDIKFMDSRDNQLIQLVDMISGSVYKRYQSGRTDSKLYFSIIEKKIITLLEHNTARNLSKSKTWKATVR